MTGFARLALLGLLAIAVGGGARADDALKAKVAVLVAARVVQGAGGAVFAPLAMTLLSAATRPERRGAVLGAWGGIGGLGAAAGGALVHAVANRARPTPTRKKALPRVTSMLSSFSPELSGLA